MIVDAILPAIQNVLSNALTEDVSVVPEDEVFPTSGRFFVQVKADTTAFNYNDQEMIVEVYFTIISSVRTRTYPTHLKRTPYLALIDLHEAAAFTMMQQPSILVDILNIDPSISLTERLRPLSISDRVQIATAEFFGSKEATNSNNPPHPMAEAGYFLDQSWVTPQIHIPWKCGNLPSAFLEVP